MTIEVLVVDDDTLVRAGLRMMIETRDDLAVVGEAGNGDDAIRMANDLRFARLTADGTGPTDVTNRDLDRLTDREREALVQIAGGLSNREIADALYVGESTIKTHVKHILGKLNLRDRIHAVIYAYGNGLIESDRT